jgi:hypothetical protein
MYYFFMILSGHDSVASSSVGWVSGIPLTFLLFFHPPFAILHPRFGWFRLATLAILQVCAAIQSKCLSINTLHSKSALFQTNSIQGKSR